MHTVVNEIIGKEDLEMSLALTADLARTYNGGQQLGIGATIC